MLLQKLLASATIVAVSATMAFASPVSPIALDPGVTVIDTVNVLSNGDRNDQNWFTFSATAGSLIDIDINRRAAPPDLYATLYFGDVTGVDFDTDGSGGLTNAITSDDAENDAHGGPWGDPRFTFTAQSTGTYSFFVTALSCCSSPGAVGTAFDVTATGIAPSAVPLPAGLPLLAAALGAFGFARTRRRTPQA